MVEVGMPKHHVLDLGRVKPRLFHAGNEDVSRLILVIQGIKEYVALVGGNQPCADAGVSNPVKVVEQALDSQRYFGVRRRIRSEAWNTVGHADSRPVLVRGAARGLAEYRKIKL